MRVATTSELLRAFQTEFFTQDALDHGEDRTKKIISLPRMDHVRVMFDLTNSVTGKRIAELGKKVDSFQE